MTMVEFGEALQIEPYKLDSNTHSDIQPVRLQVIIYKVETRNLTLQIGPVFSHYAELVEYHLSFMTYTLFL